MVLLLWGSKDQDPVLQQIVSGHFTSENDEIAREWFRAFTNRVTTIRSLLIACEIYNSPSTPFELDLISGWKLQKKQSNYSNWCSGDSVSDDRYALAIAAFLGVGHPDDDPGEGENIKPRMDLIRLKFGSELGKSWATEKAGPFIEKFKQAYRDGELRFPRRVSDLARKMLEIPEPNMPEEPPSVENRRLWQRKHYLLGGVSAAAVTVAAALSLSPLFQSAPVPAALQSFKAYAECVPGGGAVTVDWNDGAADGSSEFDCPATGWLPIGPKEGLSGPIRTVTQSAPDLSLQPETLNFGNATRTVYRPQRSVTELALADRELRVKFGCGGEAVAVSISRPGALPFELTCSGIARPFRILAPEQAFVELTFLAADGRELRHCKTVFEHVDTVDLGDPGICRDTFPDRPAAPPLRPFVEGLDTFTDPESGLVFMRDLFRYGSAARIDPNNVDNSVAVLLQTVARDTGRDDWRVASEVEAKTADRRFFLPQGSRTTKRLRGIAAGMNCFTGGLGKIDIAADPETAAPGTGFRLARPCNLNAPDFGVWLVRDP